MKTLYCCCTFLFLFGCVSKKELSSLNEIAKLYGGSVNLTYGFEASTKEKDVPNGKFFKIEVNDAGGVEQFENPALPASNVAYMFIKDLTSDELKDYSYVKVVLKNGDDEYEEEYSINSLMSIKRESEIFNNVCLLLKSKDYPNLFKKLHKEIVVRVEEGRFQKELENVDSIYGKIKSMEFQGFTSSTEQIGETYSDLVTFSGILIREKQNTQISITVDTTISDRRITELRF